jgi:glutaredoxin 3
MNSSAVRDLWSVARKLCGTRPQQSTDNGPRAIRHMYKPNRVRLFVKPYCAWCAQAMDWLDNHGIKYEVRDVVADEKAYTEMYQLSGQTLAPVIDVDGRILADFGAHELAAFWKKLEQAHA